MRERLILSAILLLSVPLAAQNPPSDYLWYGQFFQGLPAPPPAAPAAPVRQAPQELDPGQVRNFFKYSSDWAPFIERVLKRLQDSPTGRDGLSKLIGEYGLTGRVVVIAPKTFSGSIVYATDGIEGIHGGALGESDPRQGSFNFNPLLARFKNQKAGADLAAAVMGHELDHLFLNARVERLAPEYKDVFENTLVNEQLARLRGMIIAWELNSASRSDMGEWGAQVAADPRAYWEDLKLRHPVYAQWLDQAEMRDPQAAYGRRLEALRGHLAAQRVDKEKFGRQLRQIGHMIRYHGMPPDAAQGLREEAQGLLDASDPNIASTEQALRDVDARRAWLNQAGNAALWSTQRASDDPRFTWLFERLAASQKRLLELVKPLPAPARPAGRLSWEEFDELWARHHDGLGEPWKERASPK